MRKILRTQFLLNTAKALVRYARAALVFAELHEILAQSCVPDKGFGDKLPQLRRDIRGIFQLFYLVILPNDIPTVTAVVGAV